MKPFLKWAGNKYQIIERIKAVLPKGSRLLEPFVGAGAVFLNTNYDQYLLTDVNNDLIQLYQHVKSQGSNFVKDCQQFFVPENNTEEQFYNLRTQFNNTEDLYLKSRLFVYLNKHSFNGLCRYNTKGEFNAPFGQYEKPYFPAKEILFFHQQAQRATFKQADFLATMRSAEIGDVVYCDPPYVPLSKTANFTSYSADAFGEQQQMLLAEAAEELAERDITVIISNHNTAFTQQIYCKAEILQFDVQRYISCKGAGRNKATELLAIFN